MTKMIEFQITKNGEIDKTSNSLPNALENMISSIQEEIVEGCENCSYYELLCKHGKHCDCLARFPDEQQDKQRRSFHPFLQNIIENGIFDNNGYLHEINHILLLFDELERNKYTVIKGNDHFLDSIKYIDISEFNLVFCPNCNSIQPFTVEGCDELITFTCDKCQEVILDAFKNK